MVDSSVGGKTGINLPAGKNLVGAFHQPRAVVADLDLLDTLPARELRAGFAEVIKTAAIGDRRLFGFLHGARSALLGREAGALARVVSACCRFKAGVVRRDERELGLRMVLNFGHTLAHAIEAAGDYGRLLHGEAVAIGMAFACELGEALGTSERGTTGHVLSLLDDYGLPTALPRRMATATLLRAMGRDKKRGAKGLRWVLLERIGRPVVREDVPWDVVRRAVERFVAGRPIKI
jgi:3-dehydroquinate synthase